MALNSNVKKINTLEIVKALKHGGAMTKSDLVRLTGLTNVTVNNFINDLKIGDFVREVGVDFSTGGRNALLYQFNSQRFYSVGLVIGISEISLGLFDFDLEQSYEKSLPLNLNDMTVERGIDYIAGFVKDGIGEMGVESGSIAGLGISVPGPVNFKKGVVQQLVNIPAWENVPLKAIMEKQLGLPVIVDKDNFCNVACLRWLNPRPDNENFVYLGLIGGVGSGVVINGKILRGQHFIFGELGHMGIDRDGEVCKCGNRGCVELYISDAAIINRTRDRLDAGEASSLSGIDRGRLTMGDIVREAAAGDAFAHDVLYSRADVFVELLDRTIKAYDPDKIIFHSLWMHKCPELFNHIVNRIYKQSMLIGRDEMTIELNETSNLFLKGAATLVLDDQFSLSSPNSLLFKRTTAEVEAKRNVSSRSGGEVT